MTRETTCAAIAIALAACGGSTPAAPKNSCALSLDTLPGQSFVMLKALPENKSEEDAQARMQFSKDGETLKVRYSVNSLSNVYDYTCAPIGEHEVVCKTEPKFDEICRSLEIHDPGSCSAEAIAKLGFEGDAATVSKAVAEAKKEVAEHRPLPLWKQYSTMHHNVGNPVQGLLYAKVDSRHCRLQIDDMMATVYKGKRIEDFNPVGTNPFVKTDDDLLFADCDDTQFLIDLDTSERPTKKTRLQFVRPHEVGKPVHFYYLGDKDYKASDGCAYSMDTYAQWRPVAKGTSVSVLEDGRVDWRAEYTFSDADLVPVGGQRKGSVFHMVRKKSCAGEPETIDVTCALALAK